MPQEKTFDKHDILLVLAVLKYRYKSRDLHKIVEKVAQQKKFKLTIKLHGKGEEEFWREAHEEVG